ncbi:DNA repair protein RAD16 [Tilletia horrida]|uniref:DNA repair protein RAD16 n=1 Tax=Tilletia horrida TaxID=155126 RepID=A0AAN6GIT1_9BASI|nr:DNA repair protein RAD16 [Tilletia horrida]
MLSTSRPRALAASHWAKDTRAAQEMNVRLTSATPSPADYATADAQALSSTNSSSSAGQRGSVHFLSKASLLPFHRYIIRTLIPGAINAPLPSHKETSSSKSSSSAKSKGKEKEKEDIDASDNALVILARGLGLRRIVATVLKIYDGPHNLVILVNAQADEEAALAEELTTLGVKRPGLRSVSHEMNAKTRQELYLSGGLLSVTSRILVVDMLNKRIPTHLITGIVVLHAEKVSPTSVEAFIVRIYRQENQDGFLKAFSDDAEHFALGLSPLQTVLRQLQIRKVDLWPRFHQSIVRDLGQRRPDVIELHQPLNRAMLEIQTAIMECLEATLGELKRSSATIDIEEFTVDNAIFRSFDIMVRRQLDPVWHRVGPKTKQLVSDLTTLRSLMTYLLSYDAVTFQSYLETLIAANTTNFSGGPRQNPSPWLGLDAANTIFREAKARVYVGKVDEEALAKREAKKRRKVEKAVAERKALAERRRAARLARMNEANGSTNGATVVQQASGEAGSSSARLVDNARDELEHLLAMEAEHTAELHDSASNNDAATAAEISTTESSVAEVEQQSGDEDDDDDDDVEEVEDPAKPSWVPPGIEPTLDELPKWGLLREVMEEIEAEIHYGDGESENASSTPKNNTILIMVSTDRTCAQVREFLGTMHEGDEYPGNKEMTPGRRMMLRLFKNYFHWKGGLGRLNSNVSAAASAQPSNGSGGSTATGNGSGPNGGSTTASSSGSSDRRSEAMKRKDSRNDRCAAKRRRQRGGAAAGAAGATVRKGKDVVSLIADNEHNDEADRIDRLITDALKKADVDLGPEETGAAGVSQFEQDAGEEEEEGMGGPGDRIDEVEFDAFFGMLNMVNLVVVRVYRGDEDDKALQELRPRFVVMYDPDLSFIRRVEVYRSSSPGVGVRVYFLMYQNSTEEQHYLSSLRREKDAFEKLIKEKAVMALPLQADGKPAASDANERLLRTINSRIAGGQRVATSERPRIVVDLREFRSSLPSMLHAAGILVLPCTLQVGDYILSKTMCVERKSIPDLMSSFNSGRLYTQCELMSIHYQHPILLIEFDQDKSFSLQSMSDMKANVRNLTRATTPNELDLQAKLVILTTAFPRLRVIWSSSPYATSDIFAELKQNYEEPNVEEVAAVGLAEANEGGAEAASVSTTAGASAAATGSTSSESVFNLTPQDMLRALPGITTKNYRYVMNQVRDLAELCAMSREEIQAVIGSEPGRVLHNFINRNMRELTTGQQGGR